MILSQKYSLNKESNDYFLSFKNKIYQINRYYYYLLSAQKEENRSSVQLSKLKENFNLSDYEVEIISSEFNKFVSKLDKGRAENSRSYIKCRRILLSRIIVHRLSSKFKFLFNSVALFILIPPITFLNIYLISSSSINADLFLNWPGYLIIVFAIFFLGIFHELGHASALTKYRQEPNEIGVGFYFIFPVFYSNVTSTWLLPRKEKILVNVGGMYFQLLINSLLILLIILPVGLPYNLIQIIRSIALYNLSIVIYNLLPFLRQDGYWIYADLFGIRNLMSRANTIHKELKFKKIKETWPIAIYSVVNWIFRIYMIIVLGRIAHENLPKFNSLDFSKEILSSYLLLFLSCTGLLLMLKNILEILTNKIELNEGY